MRPWFYRILQHCRNHGWSLMKIGVNLDAGHISTLRETNIGRLVRWFIGIADCSTVSHAPNLECGPCTLIWTMVVQAALLLYWSLIPKSGSSFSRSMIKKWITLVSSQNYAVPSCAWSEFSKCPQCRTFPSLRPAEHPAGQLYMNMNAALIRDM